MNIVFFTGAGISAASGIRPYRGKDGIYEETPALERLLDKSNLTGPGYDELMTYCSELKDLILAAEPNAAHRAIADLEISGEHEVTVITQNIDNLHQRAGSSNVLELHGNLFRDIERPTCVTRPDVVFFGELLDQTVWNLAERAIDQASYVFAVGTSGSVQPAVSLLQLASDFTFSRAGRYQLYSLNLEPMEYHLAFCKHVMGDCTQTLPYLLRELELTKED